MSKRKWELPGVQDLTKDQEVAIACPSKGQHLVIGGPGTGKTVVTMLRARQLYNQNVEHTFLVYNHMLHEASRQIAEEWFWNSSTYIKWFCEKFKLYTGMAQLPRSDSKYIDWEKCMDVVLEIAKRRKFDRAKNQDTILLIDEGQDMPPQFYGMLIEFGYENFFVAADQNQQITEDNSSRRDLEDGLDIDSEDVIQLKHNHRNHYGVARLAQHFYTGDPASPRPELPERKGASLDVPRLYTSENSSSDVYERIAKSIVNFLENHPNKLIGVITPNNHVRDNYYKNLKRDADNRRKDFSIQTYSTGNPYNVRFDEGGIMVLNAQSCKGLEFDIVILADIDQHRIFRDRSDEVKKLFYVMVSRAREKVFLFFMQGAYRSPILNILPNDESILRRIPIN